jgi:hypothetical protein
MRSASRRWPEPEKAYYRLGKSDDGYVLGTAQLVMVKENLWVANMIGQRGVGKRGDNKPPIRYEAIRTALRGVAFLALDPEFRGPYKACSIHAPRFGAGLAGGDWNMIEQIIKEELVAKSLSVTVYDYDG